MEYLYFAALIWVVTVLMAYFNARRMKQIIQDLIGSNEMRGSLQDKGIVITHLKQNSDNLEQTIALLQGQYKINSLTSTYNSNGDLRGITVDGMELLVPNTDIDMFPKQTIVTTGNTSSLKVATGDVTSDLIINKGLAFDKEITPMKTKTNGDGMSKHEESVKKSIAANKVKKTTKKEIKEVAKIATKQKSAKEKTK